MKTTLRPLGLMAAVLASTLAAKASDTTVVLTQRSGTGSTGGGEFNASVSNAPADFVNLNAYVSGVTSNLDSIAGSFQTFCIESQVEFYPSATYYVAKDTVVRPSTAMVDPHTAWLYAEFASNGLTDYDYSNDGGRGNSADALQMAIWYFQGQKAPYTNLDLPDQSSNKFVLDAIAAFTNNLTAAETEGVNVKALVLYSNLTGDPGYAQDQLVIAPPDNPQTNSTPTPDGGSSALLVGAAMVGLVAFRRKVGKSATAQIFAA